MYFSEYIQHTHTQKKKKKKKKAAENRIENKYI